MHPVYPKLIPSWLTIKNTNYSVVYDLNAMIAKDDGQINNCNELITTKRQLNLFGVFKIIPIPSFDDDINPQYLILPYMKDFIMNINDPNKNSILYKVYFQSMKCVNIINKNTVNININLNLNKHYAKWIVKTVSVL